MDSDKKVTTPAIAPADALFGDTPREARAIAGVEREIEYNRHQSNEVQRVRCGGGVRIMRKHIGGN